MKFVCRALHLRNGPGFMAGLLPFDRRPQLLGGCR
jgi:hypothetical protein